MESYDGAEICELVGLYLLNRLSNVLIELLLVYIETIMSKKKFSDVEIFLIFLDCYNRAFAKVTRNHLLLNLFLNKISAWSPTTLLKQKLSHIYFVDHMPTAAF